MKFLRQRKARRRTADSDVDVTTFMNLMVVLVPFLLATAVFSRINIVELSLPAAAGGPAAATPKFRLEVIVRDAGLELSNGDAVIAVLPKKDGAYDLATLGEMVVALKRQYPDSNEASVLLEPRIEYDHLIQVMDVVRSAPLPKGPEPVPVKRETGGSSEPTPRIALFTEISIGDAP